MSFTTTFTGVPEFERAVDVMRARVDRATERATTDGLLAIERQAKINSTDRPGPRVRTGSHRRGIRTISPARRVAVGRWEGVVGPTLVYSRRLELGGGNWPSGLRFPYFRPAVVLVTRTVLPRIYRREWGNALS